MRGKNIIWMAIAFAMILSAMPLTMPVAVASTPHVYIDPPTVTPEVGTQFTVDIKISGVVDNDIYTWAVRLYLDPIMIDFVSATEGSYLLDYAGPEGTFFIVGELPPARQYVDLACTILGPYMGASGDGTLASVTFAVLDIGEASIELRDIQLIDSGLHIKPYTSTDGTVDVHSEWLNPDLYPDFYADLQEKRVDNRHFSLSIHGTLITAYAKIKNWAHVPLYVRGRFTGATPIGKRTWDTTIKRAQPNEVTEFLTYNQALTTRMRGEYSFSCYALYSYGGSRWLTDEHKVKFLTFVVVD